MEVWKFNLWPLALRKIYMPEGAKVLHVGNQHDEITLWALVDPDSDLEERWFLVVGTGHSMPDAEFDHLGTVITHDKFVWHVFEEAKPLGKWRQEDEQA